MGRELSVWIELAKAIPSVVTAVTAVVGVCIAARGLNKWRAETICKRKAELAEEVLADFYQARDIIDAARLPGIFGHEGATRPKAEWESEEDTRTLNAYFVTYERLRNKDEFFAQFQARRYRFMAHFGPEAGNPYDDLHKIKIQIVAAVRMLVETYRQRTQGSLPEDRRAWEATIGWRPLEDVNIHSQLAVLINDIERICCPAIQEAAKGTSSWPKLPGDELIE
jgi:hypothetical protein